MDNKVDVKIFEVKSRIAAALEDMRYSQRLTQQQMAEACGIMAPQYSKIKNGNYEGASIDFLLKVYCRAGLEFELRLFV